MAVSRAERVVEQDKGDFRGMPGSTSSEEESPAVRSGCGLAGDLRQTGNPSRRVRVNT